jgi:glycosyltransferase involved in cell wall biosynthesis
MKIAYVVSGMKMTFVVNEMEAHNQAGWEILPLASRRPESLENLSEVLIKWCRRAVYRPRAAAQVLSIFRELITNPIRLLKIWAWTFGLIIHSPVEFAKAAYELPAACDFARHCRRFGVEHIHVHFVSRSLSLGLMLGLLTGLPVSCTAHAFDIFTRSRGSLRPRLSKCRFIVAISEYNVEHLRRTCGDAVANLCHIVHCGIDLKLFKAGSRQPQAGLIVSVAKLVPKKGFDLAIAACAKLQEMNVDFVFQIVGDGPERQDLEQQIERLGLRDRVMLLGSRPNDQLLPLLSRACVFLMPCVQVPSGDMDGIPVAMMEAMACGVPVVSRRISGIPELIRNGVDGLLVENKQPGEIAEAVATLLLDSAKMQLLGRAAREQVELNFDIVNTSAELRELIQSCRRFGLDETTTF